jgi:hypothetical protein
MKKMFFIIALLAGVLFLTACTEQAAPKEQTTNPNSVGFQESKLEVKDLEVWYVNEQFFPETISVKEGDHVRIFLMNTENMFFSIPDFGVNENINHGYIEFVADKKGSFEFYCQDCDEPTIGFINVV